MLKWTHFSDRAYMGALFWHLSLQRWVCMRVYVWLLSDMRWFQSAGRFYLQTQLACGKTKWKKKRGLPLNCQGLYTVRSVMCQQNRFGGIDLTDKRVTERREGLGWVRGGGLMEGAFFSVLFLSFLFLYPLRHFVIVYSVLRSKKVNILDWLQLSGRVICCMCGFSEI